MIPPHERRILEAFVRGVPLSRLAIETRELNEYEQQQLKTLIKDRVKGFPLQYLIGSQDFYGREFYVNTSVLIPRPETEGLVELLLKNLPEREMHKRLQGLELGTGSGCISITVALERNDTLMSATDCSHPALEVSEENARKWRVGNVNFHHVSEEPQLWQYDFSPYYDFIISNPPYLSREDEIAKDVREHEPVEALFAPEDDLLHFYKFLAGLVREKLVEGGVGVFEVAENRATDTALVFEQVEGTKTEILKDLTGRDRYLLVKKERKNG